MHMEAINGINNTIKDKFKQPGFKVFGQGEQLLLKSIRKDSVVDEIENLVSNFKGGYDLNSLIVELELCPVISGEYLLINLADVVKVIQSFFHGKC